jgi:hypothetical protein
VKPVDQIGLVKFQKLTTDGDNIGRITLAMKVTITEKSRKGWHRKSIRRSTKSSDIDKIL